MKYVKTLGLASVAAALIAFSAVDLASGTVLCKVPGTGSPTGTTCPAGEAYSAGQELHAVLEPGTTSSLVTEVKTIECSESTSIDDITPEEGTPLASSGGSLSFGKCNCTVSVLKAGTVWIEWISGTHNGTVTSSGHEETTTCSTIFGSVHCIFVTQGDDLGTLTGGNPATLDITASTPRLTTNALCSSEATWHAKYEITTPKPLYVAGHT